LDQQPKSRNPLPFRSLSLAEPAAAHRLARCRRERHACASARRKFVLFVRAGGILVRIQANSRVESPLFADLALSRRLEAAEGDACAQFAVVRARLFPDSGSEAIRIAGADVVFDGIDSPTTQTFGLGLTEDVTAEALDGMEGFFRERGSSTQHEVSPFAGVAALQLLCARGYRPIEISSVLYRRTEGEAGLEPGDGIDVCRIGPSEAEIWTDVSARGWTHEHPEFEDFMKEVGALLTARESSACFLATLDSSPAAAGALSIHNGVALFAGASTVPEHRRRGLQSALLRARMGFAREQDCDLAMMVTDAGSNSQRNAERQGFRIAYTRTKWQLR
jgi:GNAT superfamily N-acetyltransferase